MTQLKDIIREIINEEIAAMDEDSEAAKQAKQQGLTNMGFGRWGKDGEVKAVSDKGKLVPFTKKASTATPSKKLRTVSQKTADTYARSKGDLARSARAAEKLRNAERAKDPDYDEKSAQRPRPAYDASITNADGQAGDTIGYDSSDPGLGGKRSIYRGRAKPDMRPREEFKKFTSKKTGKSYAWKWDTPDDIAPTLPGRSSDGGEWLDSMGNGVYGKNGVVTHREDGKKLTPLNKK